MYKKERNIDKRNKERVEVVERKKERKNPVGYKLNSREQFFCTTEALKVFSSPSLLFVEQIY